VLHSWVGSRPFSQNMRQGCKGLPSTNDLVYLIRLSVTKVGAYTKSTFEVFHFLVSFWPYSQILDRLKNLDYHKHSSLFVQIVGDEDILFVTLTPCHICLSLHSVLLATLFINRFCLFSLWTSLSTSRFVAFVRHCRRRLPSLRFSDA
jgi:hypothetical protein